MTWKKFYTKESYRLMLNVRKFILILTSPMWLPLYLLVVLAYKIEDLLGVLDNFLQKILDKVIPQIK